VALGEYSPESDEGAGTAAVVVPVGPLTGQPRQQPSLELWFAGEADVLTSDRTVGHQRFPQEALAGQAGGDLDEIDGLSVLLGHGTSFVGRTDDQEAADQCHGWIVASSEINSVGLPTGGARGTPIVDMKSAMQPLRHVESCP
jgi:hypothetical protein